MGRSRSLSFRIIVSSGAWLLTALTITAFLLVYSYRDHAAQHYDAHVTIHLEELLEASELSQDGEYHLAFEPSDPRYLDLYSGWYWEVIQSGRTLSRSNSLGDSQVDLAGVTALPEVVVHDLPGPRGRNLRVHVVEVEYVAGLDPLVFVSTAPIAGFTDSLNDYTSHIVGSFLLLAVGLLLAVVVQVSVALKPLRAIKADIARIREGEIDQMPISELEDVQTLIDELNHLLDHNAVLLNRARNQLADLAHSVKNPLSVIKNEARSMGGEQGALILKHAGDINRNINHYLSRARTFGTEKVLGARCEVTPVLEDMVFVMQRIYKKRGLTIECGESESCWFRGESQDLEEILGNLMDNASKWARSLVRVSVEVKGERLLLSVEDDGPGIPADEMNNAMRRGHRLDESKPGHGQGLGIVKDIAGLYNGKLLLSKSLLGGLKASLDLPAA